MLAELDARKAFWVSQTKEEDGDGGGGEIKNIIVEADQWLFYATISFGLSMQRILLFYKVVPASVECCQQCIIWVSSVSVCFPAKHHKWLFPTFEMNRKWSHTRFSHSTCFIHENVRFRMSPCKWTLDSDSSDSCFCVIVSQHTNDSRTSTLREFFSKYV